MKCYHILHYICIVYCVQIRPPKSLSSGCYNSVTLVYILRFPHGIFNVFHRFCIACNIFVIIYRILRNTFDSVCLETFGLSCSPPVLRPFKKSFPIIHA